jgi:SpoVK/Ycf46/Vps4 family AAA+-type ATPase
LELLLIVKEQDMNDNKVTLKCLIKGGAFFSLILLFSGCELPWAIKKEEQKVAIAVAENKETQKEDRALFLIDGNISITETDFKDHVDKIIVMNPQFKHIIETVPSVRYNIFNGMMNEKVLKAWVEKTNVNQIDQYKKDHALAVNMLNMS